LKSESRPVALVERKRKKKEIGDDGSFERQRAQYFIQGCFSTGKRTAAVCFDI